MSPKMYNQELIQVLHHISIDFNYNLLQRSSQT